MHRDRRSRSNRSALDRALKHIVAFARDYPSLALASVASIAAFLGFMTWLNSYFRALRFKIPPEEIPVDITIYGAVLQIVIAMLLVISNAFISQFIKGLHRTTRKDVPWSDILFLVITILVPSILLAFVAVNDNSDFPYRYDPESLGSYTLKLFFILFVAFYLPGLLMGLLNKVAPTTVLLRMAKHAGKRLKYIWIVSLSAFVGFIIVAAINTIPCLVEIEGTIELDDQQYAVIFSSNSSYCIEKLKPQEDDKTIIDRIDSSGFQWISKEGIVVTTAL